MGKKRRKRKQHRRNKKRIRDTYISGRMGNEVGKAGEERALKACKEVSMPKWWKGVRPATFEEDTLEKIDLVVSTDVGEIFIQIKSSLHKQSSQFPSRTSNDIAIVCINLKESDVEIRERMVRVVSEERRAILEKK